MPSDAVVEGVSGAIGGIVATVATYPLMTVNTLQATRGREVQQADVEGGGQKRQPRRRGTLHDLAEIVRVGGWQALFSGLEASLIGTTISQGIYFYLYSLLRRLAVLRSAAAAAAAAGAAGAAGASRELLDVRTASISVGESLLVASLAGMGNVLLTNPIWMVATRMQALSRAAAPPPTAAAAAAARRGQDSEEPQIKLQKPGIVAVARQVYSEYGVAGFWNGTAASLLMVINPTLQYAMYEWLQSARAKLRQTTASSSGKAPPARASALEVFLLSALAKAGATLVTYPMMNIKTRMYTATKQEGAQYGSVLQAAAEIMRSEGVGGYYKGIRTKIVQSVLAAALLFVAKEKITDFTRDVLLASPAERRRRHKSAVA